MSLFQSYLGSDRECIQSYQSSVDCGVLQLKGKRRESVFFGHVLFFLTKLPFLHVF